MKKLRKTHRVAFSLKKEGVVLPNRLIRSLLTMTSWLPSFPPYIGPTRRIGRVTLRIRWLKRNLNRLANSRALCCRAQGRYSPSQSTACNSFTISRMGIVWPTTWERLLTTTRSSLANTIRSCHLRVDVIDQSFFLRLSWLNISSGWFKLKVRTTFVVSSRFFCR